MATIGQVIGSKFIGCPIVYPVTPATLKAGAVFHRVRLVVTVNTYDFEFSQPVEYVGGVPQVVYIDVSSALRAVADRYEYTATGLNPIPNLGYPEYHHSLVAYDDYLMDGEERHTSASVTEVGGTTIAGTLTDRERLTGERPAYYSRKPMSSREIVHIGKSWIRPGSFSDSPIVSTLDVGNGLPWTTDNIYIIAAPQDTYELRFINSLGVHESLHITCLSTGETSYQTDQYVIARQETLTRFSRGVAVRQNDHEAWTLSSGPVDRAWLQYYLHEPLMARWVWLKVDGQWLPCHILPEETVAGVDRQKAGMMEVQFKVQFDINGSPFAQK